MMRIEEEDSLELVLREEAVPEADDRWQTLEIRAPKEVPVRNIVATKEQKDYISNTFDAIAAEMEGGSIGHVCYVNKVPFAILRSISDGDGGETDYQTFAEKAAHQSIEVVLEFIGRAEELK